MIRGYLTFNRKERIGVLFLLILITVLFVLPYFFKSAAGDPDPAAFEKMKSGIRKFETHPVDSLARSTENRNYSQAVQTETGVLFAEKQLHPKLFYFDPNLNSASDWQRLGLNEKLSKTILHYIEKGGQFRKPEDLGKIYGMHPSDFQRLMPYVHLPVTDHKNETRQFAGGRNNVSEQHRSDSFSHGMNTSLDKTYNSRIFHEAKRFTIVKINTADSSVWSGLPGIGWKLAGRIVRFREKLGGFCNVEQVGETFGLPDSVFKKMKPFLEADAYVVQTINPNIATQDELQSHPYIGWKIAKSIVEYRRQHGNFQSAGDLLQLAMIDSQRFVKLKPYLTLQP